MENTYFNTGIISQDLLLRTMRNNEDLHQDSQILYQDLKCEFCEYGTGELTITSKCLVC
jgi:hypothetical protein